MPYTDISIDLETLDTSPRALVTSLGIVGFNRITGEMERGFEVHVSIWSQLFRRKVSWATVKWWLKQSREAKAAFREGQKHAVSLKKAMRAMSMHVQFSGYKDAKVWTNGPEFDHAILEDIHSNTVKWPLPWKHWQNESIRTVRTFYEFKTGQRLKDIVPFEGVKHSALADAVHQAKLVIETFKVL